MANQISTVNFHGQSLQVIQQNDQLYVAIKPICENIGLTWGSQYNRIQRDEVLQSTVFITKTVADDGKTRDVVCLPLSYLNGWLFGIDTSRIKNEATHRRVIQYKQECYQVLSDYWLKGSATRQSKQPQQLQFYQGYSFSHLGLSGNRTVEDARMLLKELQRFLPSETSLIAKELDDTLVDIYTFIDKAIGRVDMSRRMLMKKRGIH